MTVKCFEWPQVLKAIYKYAVHLPFTLASLSLWVGGFAVAGSLECDTLCNQEETKETVFPLIETQNVAACLSF